MEATLAQHRRGLLDAGVLLLAALVLRAATLGDPNLHLDETFYLHVGDAMNHGAVPYLDVWDRKPLGIFLIYAAIAAVSVNPVWYQAIALAFAVATAWVLTRIARIWASPGAALMAGTGYIAMLNVLDGMGGQSPVFYNLAMALAAWFMIRDWAGEDPDCLRRNFLWAMLLCGISLTIKPTVLFESLLFGLTGLYGLWRRGVGGLDLARSGASAIALATIPTAAIAAWYAGHGWWPQWYQAMILSNLKRGGLADLTQVHNAWVLLRLLSVFGGTALLGLLAQRSNPRLAPYRGLMLAWLVVAVLALAAVPNFFSHYALPILVPLTPLAALGFDRRPLGGVLFGINLIVAAILGTAFDFQGHQASRQAVAQMVQTIARYRGQGNLLLLDGPPLLYTLTGSKPQSPLVFPEHLSNDLETDVSPIGTKAELARLIALRPSVVVVPASYVLRPRDGRIDLVDAYLARSCRIVWRGELREPKRVTKPELIYACDASSRIGATPPAP